MRPHCCVQGVPSYSLGTKTAHKTRRFIVQRTPIHRHYEAPLKLKRPTPDYAPERFAAALKASPDFSNVQVSRYAWTHRYDKTRYLDLLLTYSNVQALEPPLRDRFLVDIAGVIDMHGGEVERLYESALLSAVRLE